MLQELAPALATRAQAALQLRFGVRVRARAVQACTSFLTLLSITGMGGSGPGPLPTGGGCAVRSGVPCLPAYPWWLRASCTQAPQASGYQGQARGYQGQARSSAARARASPANIITLTSLVRPWQTTWRP